VIYGITDWRGLYENSERKILMERKEKETKWTAFPDREGLFKKGTVNVINVAHDDWCSFLKDKAKECNCNPDINVITGVK